MKEYCYTRFPSDDPIKRTPWFYDHCALAHTNEKGNPDLIPHQVFFDMSQMDFSRDLRRYLDYTCYSLLALGVFLNVLNINFSRNNVLYFAFFANLLLGSVHLFEVAGDRYGIDYIAYIQ